MVLANAHFIVKLTSLILKNRFFIVVFLLFSNFIFAQNKVSDSLLSIIQQSNVDTVVRLNYLILAENCANSNPKKSLVYLNKANEFNTTNSIPFNIVFLIGKSKAYRSLGKMDSCVKLSSQAIK